MSGMPENRAGGAWAAPGERPARPRASARDYLELTKPRLNFLVLVSTLVGFEMGRKGGFDLPLFLNTLLATSLLSGGAAALNMWMEVEQDARMRRTRNRPLPSGRLTRSQALVFGLAASVLGLAEMALLVHPAAAWLGLATWVSYVFIYTPMKRLSSLSVLAGAVPGALPPVMGWAAATGTLPPQAWVLFWIVFFWQIPHFLSIALMHRDDYERAGFKMVPLGNWAGGAGSQMILYSLALIPASLMPTVLGLTGVSYFAGALALGLAFSLSVSLFAAGVGRLSARRVLLASVTYLPLLQVLMVFDKTR